MTCLAMLQYSMCMQYIYIRSKSIDKHLATYETDQAIEYLQNLLEYDSS